MSGLWVVSRLETAKALPTGSCPGVSGVYLTPKGVAADGLPCRYFFLHDIPMLYEFSTNDAKDVDSDGRLRSPTSVPAVNHDVFALDDHGHLILVVVRQSSE